MTNGYTRLPSTPGLRLKTRLVLPVSFFNRPAEKVARELVGMFLVRKMGREERAFRITETEAYVGPHDLACHASKGRTKRTEVMFGSPAHFYVYLCYGMHWLLNVVVREKGYPAAVLIRGVEGVHGPGRVTKALGITGDLHGKPAIRSSGLWFEDRGEKRGVVERSARVGVSYAKEWASKELRFVLRDEVRNE